MNKNSLLFDINIEGCDQDTVNTLNEMMNFIKNKLQGIADKAKKTYKEKSDATSFPVVGDTYYTLTSYGEIKSLKWEGFQSEKFLAAMGNVFKTKEKADFEKNRRVISQKLKEFSLDNSKVDILPCYIRYNARTKILEKVSCNYFIPLNTVIFSSEDAADKAIKAIGEDALKKYIFCLDDSVEKNDDSETKDYYSGDDEYYNWYE